MNLRKTGIAAIALLAACSPDTPTSPNLQQKFNSQPFSSKDSTDEFSAIDRFALETRVEGSFEPGKPIVISARVTARHSTGRVRLQIVAPELEALKITGRAGQLVSETKLPAAFSTATPIQANQTIAGSARLIFPADGDYQVVVSAIKESNEPNADAVNTIRGVVHRSIWIHVTKNGGGYTTGEHLPTSFLQQRHSAAKVIPGGASMLSTTNTHHLQYYDNDATAYLGASFVKTQIRIYQGGTQINALIGQAASDGTFSFPCIASNQSAHIQAYYEDINHLNVFRPNGSTAAVDYWLYGSVCGQDSTYTVDPSSYGYEAAKVFRLGRTMIITSRSIMSPARSVISYKLNSANGSQYRLSTDDILLNVSNVWSSWGVFAITHEYGHALHEKALGGIKTGGGTCASHTAYGYYNLGCAYVEGFADYHAVIVQGFASDYAYEVTYGIAHGGNDGSINELGVASDLYALATTYTPQYVADIYRTCSITRAAGTERANGIDHMTYCFEQQVDPTVKSTYFQTRSSSSRPTSQSQSATTPGTWSVGTVRAIWRNRLYNL